MDEFPTKQSTPTPAISSSTVNPVSSLSPISSISSPITPLPTPLPVLETVHALLDMGLQLYENGEYEAAIEIFNEILSELKDMLKKESPKLRPLLITDQEYLEILRKSLSLFCLSEKKSQSLFEDTVLKEQLGFSTQTIRLLRVLLS